MLCFATKCRRDAADESKDVQGEIASTSNAMNVETVDEHIDRVVIPAYEPPFNPHPGTPRDHVSRQRAPHEMVEDNVIEPEPESEPNRARVLDWRAREARR